MVFFVTKSAIYTQEPFCTPGVELQHFQDDGDHDNDQTLQMAGMYSLFPCEGYCAVSEALGGLV